MDAVKGVIIKILFFLMSFMVFGPTTVIAVDRGVADIDGEVLVENRATDKGEYETVGNMEIETQKKTLLLKDHVVRQQKALRLLVIVIMSLLIGLIFLLFKSNKTRKNEKSYLEAKVNDRTLELQYMYSILERSYNEQKQSILKTSHDMKVQLTTIRGLCSLIKLEATDELSQAFVKDIEDKINSLTNTVNKLSAKGYLIKYNS